MVPLFTPTVTVEGVPNLSLDLWTATQSTIAQVFLTITTPGNDVTAPLTLVDHQWDQHSIPGGRTCGAPSCVINVYKLQLFAFRGCSSDAAPIFCLPFEWHWGPGIPGMAIDGGARSLGQSAYHYQTTLYPV